MRIVAIIFLSLAYAVMAEVESADDYRPATQSVEQVNIRLTQDGEIALNGTNMTALQFSEYLSGETRPDLYVLHRDPTLSAVSNLEHFVASRIALSGVPLLVSQPDGTMALGPKEAAPASLSFKLTTDHLRQLRHLSESNTNRLLLGFGGLWSPEDESYMVQRIELGLPGRKFWFIYDTEDEDEDGEAAVQWKKDW